jgi:hypothetical protein
MAEPHSLFNLADCKERLEKAVVERTSRLGSEMPPPNHKLSLERGRVIEGQ